MKPAYPGVVHLLLSRRGADWARGEGYQVVPSTIDYIAFDSVTLAQDFVDLVNGRRGARNSPPVEWAVGSVPASLLDLGVNEERKEGPRP